AVAIGGGACPGRGRADRGSGIADRDQHHRVTRGRGPRRPAPPGHAPAPGARAAGAGRRGDARRIHGRADARRRARGGPGQRRAPGRAGPPARRRDALSRGAAGLRARVARGPDPRRGAQGPRRGALAARVVERSSAPAAARDGGRPGPGGRLVLSRRSPQSRGRPRGRAGGTPRGADLPAECVTHAGIRSDTEPVTRDGVARAWRSTLEQAREWEFTSLTVPPIGTGAGNLSVEDAADIMVPILKSHLGNATFPASVSIVVETPEEREAFEAAMRRSGAAES